MRIYTKTGDDGSTSLFDGARVSKTHQRVVAYGAVDELNAHLGAARAAGLDGDLEDKVARLQRDLFAVGARLADPRHKIAERVSKATVGDDDVARLESWIDTLEAELTPLRHFILAGGTPGAAALHLARTVCRRAEVEALRIGSADVESVVLVYLNRLSDLLFVMARSANHRAGVAEHIW